jgi:hypothetical protein
VNRRAIYLLVAAVLVARSGHAGQSLPPDAAPDSPRAPSISGPAPPVAPDTITRDSTGSATVRAIRLTEPLRVDGRLEEIVYQRERPMSDFVQTEPDEGDPATEKTDVWVMFDEDNLYVTFRVFETRPERRIANVMQKDNANLFQNDGVSFFLDTFYDRRNGVGFMIGPIGGRTDGQITDERWNRDWNTIWDLQTADFDGGWSAEAAVPFKSLRYRPGRSQIWGFNARRIDRWKNEISHLTPLPRQWSTSAVWHASMAATLVGLEAPPGAKNLDIKPYAISNLVTDRASTPPVSNDFDPDVGIDLKYGISQNFTADVTLNTDFAQVEADEQQVNLTRFSLFFPEKRDFFLENPGLFTFGGVSTFNFGRDDTPLLFYSRRIGLNNGRVIPIEAGGRVTGRAGRVNVGVLNIQTGEDDVSRTSSTNFSAVRIKRDVLRRSTIGIIATGRSVGQNGVGSNVAYGIDGTFGFFTNLTIDTYWARTSTTGLSGNDQSYRTLVDYNGDRYGMMVERLVIGDNFNPEVGFVRRDDMRKSYGQFRFSPRPQSMPTIRRFSLTGSLGYIENGSGRLETRDVDGDFAIEFENSDRFTLGYTNTYEFLPRPFRISGVTVPIGAYDYQSGRVGYQVGQQRRFNGRVSLDHGSFYGGERTVFSLSSGRATVSPQFSLEPTFSTNWVDLPSGSFTTRLAGARVTYTMSPMMFTSALLQYNSDNHNVSANVRLRWEYRPGSELFVVYNEERDTLTRQFPDIRNRALIVKVNRLLRF